MKLIWEVVSLKDCILINFIGRRMNLEFLQAIWPKHKNFAKLISRKGKSFRLWFQESFSNTVAQINLQLD